MWRPQSSTPTRYALDRSQPSIQLGFMGQDWAKVEHSAKRDLAPFLPVQPIVTKLDETITLWYTRLRQHNYEREMRNRGLRIFFVLLVTLLATLNAAHAAQTYQIDGDFEGCDFDRPYPLIGGGMLVCHEYNYNYLYSSEVIIIDTSIVLIECQKYAALILSGNVIAAHVMGDFKGCEYGNIVALENNLLFECRTYPLSLCVPSGGKDICNRQDLYSDNR
jgi:hypothetical protein